MELVCKFCGKTAKSRSGLTNHEKTCSKNQGAEELDEKTCSENQEVIEELDMSTAIPYGKTSSEQASMRTSRAPSKMEATQDHTHSNGSSKPSKNPFQFGAFLVMADYVPILLDVDFCIALGDHILEHGSPNSAIMAFAHQLNKLDAE
jgi:hypothetical protein